MTTFFDLENKFARFEEFYNNKMFFDVALHSNDNVYYSHRIILVSLSEWFRNSLQNNHMSEYKDNMWHIDLPVDPENAMKNVLELTYLRKTILTVENVSSIYKICTYYGFTQFIDVIKKFIIDNITNSTITLLTTKFIEYKLINEADILIDMLATLVAENFNENDESPYMKLDDIMNLVSNGVVFACVLKSQKINISQYQKYSIVDKYCKEKNLTNEESTELASLFDWNDKNTMKMFVDFSRDWLPLSIQRQYFSMLLTNRRNIVNLFEKQAKSIESSTSRLFPYYWYHECHNSREFDDSKQFSLFELISSIADSNINPIKYSFVTCDIHGSTFELFNSINNIFKDDESYAVISSDDQLPPSISFAFGPKSNISAQKILIYSDIIRKTYNRNKSQKNSYCTVPKYLRVQTFLNDKLTNSFDSEYNENRIVEIANIPNAFNSIKIEVPKELSELYSVLRIRYISILGKISNIFSDI